LKDENRAVDYGEQGLALEGAGTLRTDFARERERLQPALRETLTGQLPDGF
jgi:hypothetical protein